MKIKDWANRLIWATILIAVVRYMGAFASSDLGKISGVLSDILTIFLAISGAGMGILDVLGGGLLFNGWRRTMPKNGQTWSFRFRVLTICVFGLVVSGLVILVPFTVSRMTQSSIVDTLGGDNSLFTWIWAGMVNFVPYFLIGGVFVGNNMIEGLENQTTSENVSEQKQNFLISSEKTSKLGRPSIHQERVFSYMTDIYNTEHRVATFGEVEKSLNLPQSTASRLRTLWIEHAQREMK